MKGLVVIFVFLIQSIHLFGQDGSDINYIKPNELDKQYIGRRLHLDFHQRSFGLRDKRLLDKIIVEINGKKVIFIEHRKDDGYNNWFSQQYLESVEKVNGLSLRIKEFELLEIDKDNILVKGFFQFVDNVDKNLAKKSFTKKLSFPKKDIVEYLFKAND